MQTLQGKSWTCQGGLQWISSFDARNDDHFDDGDVDEDDFGDGDVDQ